MIVDRRTFLRALASVAILPSVTFRPAGRAQRLHPDMRCHLEIERCHRIVQLRDEFKGGDLEWLKSVLDV